MPSEVASLARAGSSNTTPGVVASTGVAHRHVCPATVGTTRMHPRKVCVYVWSIHR